MIMKPCSEPTQLKKFQSLEARMQLSRKEKQHCINFQKGYEGEKSFEEKWLKSLTLECYILNDLFLENNNTFFQIDSLLISQKLIYLFEIKNYEGDFYIEDDNWYSLSGNEIKNPILQLRRSESLLRSFLQQHKINISIESNLVFINPAFTLYQAPLNSPILFPTQLERFMKNLNTTPSSLSDNHAKIADLLIGNHKNESAFSPVPNYDYDHLKKGITCTNCSAFMTASLSKTLICVKCGSKEHWETALLRNTELYQLLFPDRKITTNHIYDWCKVIDSKKAIRRILKKHFKHIKQARLSYFK